MPVRRVPARLPVELLPGRLKSHDVPTSRVSIPPFSLPFLDRVCTCDLLV